MKPLLDGDILKYEVGFSGQPANEEGVATPLPFDIVAGYLDDKINMICRAVDATEPPTLYLTADNAIMKELNRRNGTNDELKPNFREAMSVTKEYKGTRKAEKPFHYNNLTLYMLATYDCKVANGLEADDLMCIDQTTALRALSLGANNPYLNREMFETVICSRDKDLRQCPGWHYSWEVGKQASIGPTKTDHLGWLEKKLVDFNRSKIIGYGMSFFYYQMLVGDTVDNIQGVPGYGPVKAYKALTEDVEDEAGMYRKVVNAYQKAFKDDWKAHIREMANLLYMVRELDDEGKPVLYKPLKV